MTEIIESTATEIIKAEAAPVTFFGAADPDEFVARASKAARAMGKVVDQQKLYATVSGKKYPTVEAWTLIGSMVGVYPVVVWTREVADGWEARVEARTRDGAIVGAAEAECRHGERSGGKTPWADRASFALRAMAQTRATSRALRGPLDYIMKLAGYEATPSEEMADGAPAQARAPKSDTNGAADNGWAAMKEQMHALQTAGLLNSWFAKTGYPKMTVEIWGQLTEANRKICRDWANTYLTAAGAPA